jgi:hypothetical protein
VTAAFELAARMTAGGVLSPAAAITFELYKVDGGELIWPGDSGYNDSVGRNCWCPDAHVTVKRQMPPDNLQSRRRELALEASMEIYGRFGWLSPPKDRLTDVQNQKFGAARREP